MRNGRGGGIRNPGLSVPNRTLYLAELLPDGGRFRLIGGGFASPLTPTNGTNMLVLP